MAYCIKCGAQIADDARFCTSCGAAQDEAYIVNPPVYDTPSYEPPRYDTPAYENYQPEYDPAQDSTAGYTAPYGNVEPTVNSWDAKPSHRNKNLPAMIVIGVIVVLVILLFVLIASLGGRAGAPSQSPGSSFSSLFSNTLEDDFQTLVQGNIDEIYLGRYSSDFMRLIGATEAECNEVYLAGIEQEVEYFAYYWDIEYLPDDLWEELIELYKEIYSHSSYTVGEAVKRDSETYTVRVDIYPINIMQLVTQRLEDGAMDWFYNKYTSDMVNAMTEQEYQDYDREWADGIVALIREELPKLSNMAVRSVDVQVLQDGDGLWSIADESMDELDNYIIYYP